jgi:uncharacterized protein YbaR (Trm112 family)
VSTDTVWNPALEDILACPRDLGPLDWRHDIGTAINPRLHIGYPIREGIAQLLVTESFGVDEEGQRQFSVP